MIAIPARVRGQRVRLVLIVLCGLALSMSCLPAQPPHKRGVSKKTATAQAVVSSSGERKFQENCSRCHAAPEQLSPRITRTIVLHMRVRASLSAEDAQDILHYLSP